MTSTQGWGYRTPSISVRKIYVLFVRKFWVFLDTLLPFVRTSYMGAPKALRKLPVAATRSVSLHLLSPLMDGGEVGQKLR